MRFADELIPATLVLREKRFLAHMRLADGRKVIAHTNNTGSMRGCKEPGSRVWIRGADNPRRKLKWTWEIVETTEGALVGVNTAFAQRIAEEAIAEGMIPELAGFESMKREQVSSPGSRIDLLLEGEAGRIWVEVKSVTLAEKGHAMFPDAVSSRGLKHLRELERRVAEGDGAAMLFVIQRGDAESFGPAESIDPDYAEGLRQAGAAGVQLLAYRAEVGLEGIRIEGKVPIRLFPLSDADEEQSAEKRL